jgi:hypothetical protein
MVLCFFSDSPLDHEEERQSKNTLNHFVLRQEGTPFVRDILTAPCVSVDMCLWCVYQANPLTCACAQVSLRYRILNGDLGKYRFYQNQFQHMWCTPLPSQCERTHPLLSLWCEACFCNGCALSANRLVVMDAYDLSTSGTDLRLIRFSNFMQGAACICNCFAICNSNCSRLSLILDCLAGLVYHCVSGCMTAQVVHEMDIRSGDSFQYEASPYWSETLPAGQQISEGSYEPYQRINRT